MPPRTSRNTRLAAICGVVFVAMVGAAFAAVPLYKAFCQATGFDGTVRQASVKPDKVLDRKITIRFDANTRGLPWDFTPLQTSQEMRIGETKLAFYKVTNHGDKPLTGRAAYNVVPEQAGPYFQKLECFCFKEQTIQPGQTVEFPVVYFVDPRMVDDFEINKAQEITLSYTFFPAKTPQQADAADVKAPQALGVTPRRGL